MHTSGVRLGAGVARSYGEAAQIRTSDRAGCLYGEGFGVEACIGKNRVAPCEVADGGRS